MCQVHTAIRPICQKWLHIQLSKSDEITLAELNQLAKISNAFPGCMQQFSGQRVQNYIDASTTGCSQHVREEGCIARVEDEAIRDTSFVGEVFSLLFTADCSVDLLLS